jgi:capsid protein
MKLSERIRTAAKIAGRVLTLPSGALADETYNGASIKMLSGQWEGGENSRFRRNRSTRLVSHDTDLAMGTREFIMSKARSLTQNTPLPGAIVRRFADYCVHPQALVKWTTTDAQWNEQAADAWRSFTRNCDATGQMTLPQILRAAIISAKVDGDSFLHKEFDAAGMPKVRGIEGDRITVPNGFDFPKPSNERRIVGGVTVDAAGRKVAFTVCDRGSAGNFTNPKTLPAGEFVHLHCNTRFESYRGVSAFHAVINSLDDLKETLEAEQLAQKIGSSHTIIERTAKGSGEGIQDAFANGATDNAGNVQKLEDMAAGIKRYMAHGDDISMFSSTRPEEGWRWLVEFTIRGISLGLHLPFEFTWNLAGLTGTSVRLVSKLAERTFNAEIYNLEHKVIDPLVSWWISNEMESGRLPFNPEWMFFQAQRPSHPTVDVGRESSANLAELNAGVRTEEMIANEGGNDGYDLRVIRKAEVTHRILLAREIVSANPDIPLSQALAMMGGANIGPTYNMQPAVAPVPSEDTAPARR